MYRIIFLDYSMPEMDGPQVSLEIYRILGEAQISIPYICCCTAYTEASFQVRARQAGMDQFLSKPVSN